MITVVCCFTTIDTKYDAEHIQDARKKSESVEWADYQSTLGFHFPPFIISTNTSYSCLLHAISSDFAQVSPGGLVIGTWWGGCYYPFLPLYSPKLQIVPLNRNKKILSL